LGSGVRFLWVGTWFNVKFDGPFVPEAKVRGVVVPGSVNAEVAKAQRECDRLDTSCTPQSQIGGHEIAAEFYMIS
jgi:hypothetical protein